MSQDSEFLFQSIEGWRFKAIYDFAGQVRPWQFFVADHNKLRQQLLEMRISGRVITPRFILRLLLAILIRLFVATFLTVFLLQFTVAFFALLLLPASVLRFTAFVRVNWHYVSFFPIENPGKQPGVFGEERFQAEGWR
ncbi:MAG TPA: hypothetical protein VMZ30_22265 [Pyrinomonadaceae bacterium]|nr:hypothetical protein [Pyrinomonadaceae bacterium]